MRRTDQEIRVSTERVATGAAGTRLADKGGVRYAQDNRILHAVWSQASASWPDPPGSLERPFTPAEDHGPGNNDTIWVTNRDNGTVGVFDALTGRLETDELIAVGAGAHDVVVSERAGKAYVTVEGLDRIAVISASALKSLESIPTGDAPITRRSEGAAVWSPSVWWPRTRLRLIDTATDTETHAI